MGRDSSAAFLPLLASVATQSEVIKGMERFNLGEKCWNYAVPTLMESSRNHPIYPSIKPVTPERGTPSL